MSEKIFKFEIWEICIASNDDNRHKKKNTHTHIITVKSNQQSLGSESKITYYQNEFIKIKMKSEWKNPVGNSYYF